MKNLPVKRHHFFWMFLFWFAVADMIFLLGKIETTYAEVGAALTPVGKSLCMNTEYLGVHGDAPGLDCYRVDSGVYMAPQCDVGGRCYYNGCFPTAIGTQCLSSYPLTEKSGIYGANSESPNSVGQFYLYTVPKPTTNTPFPEGITTLGYDFELRKGTVRYTEDINNLPESKTCTKSLGLHETNNCQPYLGSAVFTQRPCDGMPAGWGCFYVDESNLTGDPLFTYHRYIAVSAFSIRVSGAIQMSATMPKSAYETKGKKNAKMMAKMYSAREALPLMSLPMASASLESSEHVLTMVFWRMKYAPAAPRSTMP